MPASEGAKRGVLPACPVEVALMVIGSKWKVLIVRDLLSSGTMRFKELQRSIGGVSQKMLTSSLRSLEACGLVRRQVFAEVPPRVEYSLTDLGLTLRPVLEALHEWGEAYRASFGEHIERE